MEFVFGKLEAPVLGQVGVAVVAFAVFILVLMSVERAYVRAIFVIAVRIASIVEAVRFFARNHNVIARAKDRRGTIPVVG